MLIASLSLFRSQQAAKKDTDSSKRSVRKTNEETKHLKRDSTNKPLNTGGKP